MKVFVNLPELQEDKEELENRVANFHATLLIEKIKQLDINDASKKKLLNLIFKDIKERKYTSSWKAFSILTILEVSIHVITISVEKLCILWYNLYVTQAVFYKYHNKSIIWERSNPHVLASIYIYPYYFHVSVRYWCRWGQASL